MTFVNSDVPPKKFRYSYKTDKGVEKRPRTNLDFFQHVEIKGTDILSAVMHEYVINNTQSSCNRQ